MLGREMTASPTTIATAQRRHRQHARQDDAVSAEPTEFPFHMANRASSSSTSSSPAVTTPKTTTTLLGVTSEQRSRYIEEQQNFADKRETLVRALDDTTGLVKSLAAFNQEKWTIHYPHELGVTASTAQRSHPTRSASAGPRPDSVRRSASTYDGPDAALHSDDNTSPSRPGPARSYSTVETPIKSAGSIPGNSSSVEAPPPHPLSILTLDLKLGQPGAVTASLPALLPSLSHSTLSQLLSRRLTSAVGHIQSLRIRVTDKSSRILVTGDLNAGKSTFVNALLRRDLMPSDQQPCTTLFCEVLDAKANNGGHEQIHAIRDIEKYDANDATTFDQYPLQDINELQDPMAIEDRGIEPYALLKVFVIDERAPSSKADNAAESELADEEKKTTDDGDLDADSVNSSFIRNGLVSISLIDAPGLNRDTLSTTALFARQSEIDVIVFVVSAENHFTLSAKEFLWNASREKAHVFVVVNKWNGIKDKKRCLRVVGEQIKQLSPKTWENRDELVHFVDAADVVDESSIEGATSASTEADEMSPFDHLEQSLRSFVLLRRTTSKLAPAKHYLTNLLNDLATLAATNVAAASHELEVALERLALVKPVHERLVAQKNEVEDGVDRVEETVVQNVRDSAWSRLERALDFVSEGRVVEQSAEVQSAVIGKTGAETQAEGGKVQPPTELPAWQGVWNLWEWAADVKRTLVRALEAEIRAAEDEARARTCSGVEQVVSEIGSKFLPAESSSPKEATTSASQQSERVFRPEVMFAKRRRGVGRLSAPGLSAGLGLGTGGLGLAPSWTATDFDVSFFDLFDFERLFAAGQWLKIRSSPSDSGKVKSSRSKRLIKAAEDDPLETSAIVGLGIGSIGMLGGRVIGVKGTLDSLTRFLEMLGSEKARRWAGPLLGVLTVGLATYIIVDLPRAIPRNIGRKLALSLMPSEAELNPASASSQQQPVTFSSAHADRIAKETRKVLRLAGWDLRERFRAALEKSEKDRREVETVVDRSRLALTWLAEFDHKVADEKVVVEGVEV
ncbi:mitofusin [Microbotryomycetes sp. JL221]|nr:mitofusin [Microbotryomycetes sp. JL221]